MDLITAFIVSLTALVTALASLIVALVKAKREIENSKSISIYKTTNNDKR